MKSAISLLAFVGLISCGAAGAPLMPKTNLGLNIGPNGIQPSASVSTQAGPVSINIGL